MSLKDLLALSNIKDCKKQGLSEERLKEQVPHLRKLVSFYREYPDLLIDQMKGPDSTFNFQFYQRVFLRIVMRHRYVYATFPRAYGKSFLSMMVLILRCILQPNSHLFVTTGGKERMFALLYCKVKINKVFELLEYPKVLYATT